MSSGWFLPASTFFLFFLLHFEYVEVVLGVVYGTDLFDFLTLKELCQLAEEFLGMSTNVNGVSSAHMLGNQIPVFTVNSKSFKELEMLL